MGLRAALLAALLVPAAQEAPRPVVAGFDRNPDDPLEGGRLLLGELGCATCHKANAHVTTKQAPVLSDAGARLRPEWIRAFLADPQKTKPGTTMPDPGTSAEEREAIVHYLMSLKPPKPLESWSGPAAKARDLFHRVGCAACHSIDDKGGVPLGDLKAKYASAAALAQFLHDPLRWRPSGRMPRMGLSQAEATALAAQFVGLPPRDPDPAPETEPGIVYEYFEGNWSKLPDWDALKPVATGKLPTFDLKPAQNDDHIGFRFRAYLEIGKDGLYTFYTTSDDGSVLHVGNVLVVNNDGVHAPQEAVGSIHLRPGKHVLTVGWFESGGGEELKVHYEGPGFPKRPIPKEALSRPTSGAFAIREERETAAFVPDPALVKKGRELFAAKRCASCHVAEPGLTSPEAARLAALKDAACKGPRYALDARQSRAIETAIARLGALEPPGPALRIARTMAALNCYACHERGGRGGPEPGRDAFFTAADPTMGDEGRIPPKLDGVGAKLKPEWLKKLFTDSSKPARPHMHVRMPTFGIANVEHLVEDFAAADPAPPDPGRPNRDNPLVGAGYKLVGTKGLSCVQCHTFAGHKSLGVPGMDLLLMPQRLRRDWFVKYLLEPAALRPGTRMPTFWPEGKAVLKDVLDGDTPRQIEAIWHYLYEGSSARLPVGMGPEPIPLVPKNEPLIYRNFVQGAGPRAIAVGYPEGVHLAFDAGLLRLALLWKGEFIDASKHWIDRGSGFQGPSGDPVVKFEEAVAFATLAGPEAPWPKLTGRDAGYSFEGYELDAKRRPVFLYRVGEASIRDSFEPAATGFTRTLSLAGSANSLWYRAASGPKIEPRPDGSFAGGGLSIRLEEAVRRKAGGGWEVVRPVKFKDGKATIVVHYAW